MIIPIGTDYRFRHKPWMNYLLIAANLVVFAVPQFSKAAAGFETDSWMLHPEDPRLFQFFTSVFLHGGWLHLLGNMIFLWVFGNPLNDRLGHAGYLAFYLAGGVAAGIGYVLFSGQAPVLGASGAISAVTGAYLVLLPRARVTVLVFLLYLLIPFEVSSLFFLLLQFLFNVVSVYTELEGHGSGVAWFAHITGYIFGFVVAATMLATRILPRDPFDLLSLFRAGGRRVRYKQMVAGGFDPFAGLRRGGQGPQSRREEQDVPLAELPPQTAQEMQYRRQIAEAYAQHDLASAAEGYLRLLVFSPEAVLGRAQQLDVANQLMSTDRHLQAAQAYERYLRHYGNSEHGGDVCLMLGLLYRRYLREPLQARQRLEMAARLLRDPRKIELAQSELASLGPPV